MNLLPDEIQNKILFPKYYKIHTHLTLNQKIYVSFQLYNKSIIANQITYLVKEFKYQKNRKDYNIWRRSSHPNYIFILYRCLVKKNKEHTLDLTRKNYFRYFINNIYNGVYSFYNLHVNLINNIMNYTNQNQSS